MRCCAPSRHAAAAPLAAIRVLPQSAPLVAYHAAQVLLGVVASDVRLAVRSLRDYCQSLGLPFRVRSGGLQLLLPARLPAGQGVLCILTLVGCRPS